MSASPCLTYALELPEVSLAPHHNPHKCVQATIAWLCLWGLASVLRYGMVLVKRARLPCSSAELLLGGGRNPADRTRDICCLTPAGCQQRAGPGSCCSRQQQFVIAAPTLIHHSAALLHGYELCAHATEQGGQCSMPAPTLAHCIRGSRMAHTGSWRPACLAHMPLSSECMGTLLD